MSRTIAVDQPRLAFQILDYASWPIAAVGILAFISVAVFGFGKYPGSWMFDFNWYYAGGRCFWLGSHMYDFGCFAREFKLLSQYEVVAAINYPPQFSPFVAILGRMSYSTATSFITFVNITLTLLITLLTVRILREETASENFRAVDKSLAIGLVFGCSGLWGVIWLGQITLVLVLCLWLGMRAAHRGEDVAAGILLGIITIKPQLAIIYFVWLILHGRLKILMVAGTTAFILAIPIFVLIGPLTAIDQWIDSLTAYQRYEENQLGNKTILGVTNLLWVAGIPVPLWATLLTGVAIALFFRLKLKTEPFSNKSIALLICLQMIIYSRAIDTILLVPTLAVIWPLSNSQSSHIVAFIVVALIVCVPEQLVNLTIPFDLFQNFRTLLIIGMLVAFYNIVTKYNNVGSWR